MTVHLDDQHTLLETNSYANTALGGGASRNRPQSRSAGVSVHNGPDPSLTSPLQALCDALDCEPLGSKLRLHLESRVRTKVPAVCVQRLGWGVQVADRVFLVQDREGCRRVFWEREGNPEQWQLWSCAKGSRESKGGRRPSGSCPKLFMKISYPKGWEVALQVKCLLYNKNLYSDSQHLCEKQPRACTPSSGKAERSRSLGQLMWPNWGAQAK